MVHIAPSGFYQFNSYWIYTLINYALNQNSPIALCFLHFLSSSVTIGVKQNRFGLRTLHSSELPTPWCYRIMGIKASSRISSRFCGPSHSHFRPDHCHDRRSWDRYIQSNLRSWSIEVRSRRVFDVVHATGILSFPGSLNDFSQSLLSCFFPGMQKQCRSTGSKCLFAFYIAKFFRWSIKIILPIHK